MKMQSILPATRVRRVQHHLTLAAIYLEDGARSSALCHIEAAQRVTRGQPIPRGKNFWLLLRSKETVR